LEGGKAVSGSGKPPFEFAFVGEHRQEAGQVTHIEGIQFRAKDSTNFFWTITKPR
jgi:hypothetical protein